MAEQAKFGDRQRRYAAEGGARQSNNGELTLHVAVLGMNLETRVGAGENHGKTLRHDFVALGVVSTLIVTVSSAARRALLPAQEKRCIVGR